MNLQDNSCYGNNVQNVTAAENLNKCENERKVENSGEPAVKKRK